MRQTIYILHESQLLSEALAWSVELGTDLKAICLKNIKELNDASVSPALLLTEADYFESIISETGSHSFPILLITGNPEDDKVIEALYAGVADVADISKGPEVALEKIEHLLNKKSGEKNALIRKLIQKNKIGKKEEKDETEYGLTVKEKEILKQMRDGNHLKLIALSSNTSYETVRTHVKRIYKKLGVMSASEAVIKAMKMEL
jgi:DNA-binding NarL/FixJ family response regulator